jgi:hypothetical protein
MIKKLKAATETVLLAGLMGSNEVGLYKPKKS